MIVVGNEILRGLTVDTNSNWLAGRLFRCGYPVRIITTVGDVDVDIVGAIHDHIARAELSRIFVCGGLGPPPDDRTYIAPAPAPHHPPASRREGGGPKRKPKFFTNNPPSRGRPG